jgi:hypothetical protein
MSRSRPVAPPLLLVRRRVAPSSAKIPKLPGPATGRSLPGRFPAMSRATRAMRPEPAGRANPCESRGCRKLLWRGSRAMSHRYFFSARYLTRRSTPKLQIPRSHNPLTHCFERRYLTHRFRCTRSATPALAAPFSAREKFQCKQLLTYWPACESGHRRDSPGVMTPAFADRDPGQEAALFDPPTRRRETKNPAESRVDGSKQRSPS